MSKGYAIAALAALVLLSSALLYSGGSGRFMLVAAVAFAILLLSLGLLLFRAETLRRDAEQARDEITALAEKHRRSAADLAKRNEWLTMTEALAHVGHWRLDLADNSLFLSDEVYAIHGWDLDTEPTLEDGIAAYHEDDREKVEQAVETARTTGEPYAFDARLVRENGELRHVQSIAKVETDNDGTPVALFGVFADRTEEFELRHALREVGEKAYAAADAKSTFLATMSHEIRTPMNGVVGFTDLLLRSELDSQQRQFAEIIAESAKAMTMLLNDILDLSKIDAGEVTLAHEPTDIAHLLRHAIKLVEPQASEKGLQLELDISGELPRHCVTDPLRLRQVVGNLLGNAVKFTDRGFVSLSTEWADDVLTLVVRDSGAGIAVDEQDIVFDAFAQAKAGARVEKGGTGLGLAISRQLAHLLDGSLELESQLGEGSTFTLKIAAPTLHVEPAIAPKGDQEGEAPGSRKRVLVAEDYDINQILVEAMAQRAGIDCVIASDGGLALAMVEQAEAEGDPFALVLMDLQMPEIDGYEAAQRLRAKGYDADRLPIVAMTANAFPEDIRRCLDIGMQDHLAKPVTYESFCSTLDKWMPPIAKAA